MYGGDINRCHSTPSVEVAFRAKILYVDSTRNKSTVTPCGHSESCGRCSACKTEYRVCSCISHTDKNHWQESTL